MISSKAYPSPLPDFQCVHGLLQASPVEAGRRNPRWLHPALGQGDVGFVAVCLVEAPRRLHYAAPRYEIEVLLVVANNQHTVAAPRSDTRRDRSGNDNPYVLA